MKALAAQDKDDDDDEDGDNEQPLLFDQTFALKLWLTGSSFSLLLAFSLAVALSVLFEGVCSGFVVLRVGRVVLSLWSCLSLSTGAYFRPLTLCMAHRIYFKDWRNGKWVCRVLKSVILLYIKVPMGIAVPR